MDILQPIKKLLTRIGLEPDPKWKKVAIVSFAVLVGLGVYLFKISNAVSYLSDDPQACVNCHIMTPQYITWNHSSHREVAHCNDCHVPHDNIFNKYFFKAKDGLYHASVFTMRAEPEVITALEPSRAVIQSNCIRCHEPQVTDAKMTGFVENHHSNRTDRTCWECHREVPHGRVKSLSSVGHQIEPIKLHTPEEREIIPSWLKESLKEQKSKQSKP
ncbi:cytochrome c nitrite reductase small subunit [Marivirga harenae]|uniref:cytochrome c nitrite reductase small subunit n=1 Tax=Marivirga harenae TaxID=2010992 RepID=UPI0026DF9CE5|nr:cytochrome c nitrite reductase small subunit [Marivirga harenae]WKV12957.1 cytochrome c nitrite reductase small subunit [Marivirga harenae]